MKIRKPPDVSGLLINREKGGGGLSPIGYERRALFSKRTTPLLLFSSSHILYPTDSFLSGILITKLHTAFCMSFVKLYQSSCMLRAVPAWRIRKCPRHFPALPTQSEYPLHAGKASAHNTSVSAQSVHRRLWTRPRLSRSFLDPPHTHR